MKINEDLKKLIQPLSIEEKEILTQSIKHEGCRDALVVWDDTLIDGHNRYEICTAFDIPFNTINKEFENIEEAKQWMINNQLGRRNLTDGWKYELIQVKKALLIEKGREKQKTSTGGITPQLLPTMGKGCSHNSRDELSNELSWSNGKISRADKVWAQATPEVKEQIKAGETTFNQAYNAIRLSQKKKEYVKSSAENIITPPVIHLIDCIDYLNSFEDNSIDAIITDPPYITDIDDINKFVRSWLPLAIQKTKLTGRMYICTGAYPKEVQVYLNVLLDQDKFIIDNPLIWTYRNTLGVTPKMKYNLNYQMIWHLYSKDSPELDTGITNDMFSVQDINAPDGRIGNRLHTWQKPDELADRLVRQGTLEGWQIIDPFACTGTFLLSGARMGRNAEGGDNNLENIKIAEERGCKIEIHG